MTDEEMKAIRENCEGLPQVQVIIDAALSARAEVQRLRVELELDHRAHVASGRMTGLEEAKNAFRLLRASFPEAAGTDWDTIARKLTDLAASDPALCVVATEARQAAIDAMTEAQRLIVDLHDDGRVTLHDLIDISDAEAAECPEDDTCTCPFPARFNDAHKHLVSADRALSRYVSLPCQRSWTMNDVEKVRRRLASREMAGGLATPKSQELADTRLLLDAVDSLRAELETARAEADKITFGLLARLSSTRALAIEEAAREFIKRWDAAGGPDNLDPQFVENCIRALAPLDPALCVVAIEAKQAAIDAIKRLLAQVEGRTSDDSIPRTTPAEDAIAALSLLGAGR